MIDENATTAAAVVLHDLRCDDGDTATCRRWQAGIGALAVPADPHRGHIAYYREHARLALAAAAPVIAAQAARDERQAIIATLIDGDPGALEQAFRAILDDEEAAECAGIVADLLRGAETNTTGSE